jgi:hypothetical protein
VPPFGIVSLGSYLYVIDQVPENASNSLRISGPGSGLGIEGAADAEPAGFFVSCCASAVETQIAIARDVVQRRDLM